MRLVVVVVVVTTNHLVMGKRDNWMTFKSYSSHCEYWLSFAATKRSLFSVTMA